MGLAFVSILFVSRWRSFKCGRPHSDNLPGVLTVKTLKGDLPYALGNSFAIHFTDISRVQLGLLGPAGPQKKTSSININPAI